MADVRSIIYQAGVTFNPTSGALTGATALVANEARGAFSIQNLSTNPLYVLLASGCTTSVFHVILKASSVANDGSGGVLSMEAGCVYTGIVTVAGTSPSYVVTEI